MRLRNKAWTDKFLEENDNLLIDKDVPLDAQEIFGNNNNLEMEIGCGKGSFINAHAYNEKETNFLAMEKEKTVIGIAMRQTIKISTELGEVFDNLRYLNCYIEKYEHQIPDGSLKKIYLNFSDPWPKARHAKNRLTNRRFLAMYSRMLGEGGEIHIKTDNDSLYKFTLGEVIFSNFRITLSETNLYGNEELLKTNISSEYELKFHEMGIKIKKIILQKKTPIKKPV